jgi:hypothetical protein
MYLCKKTIVEQNVTFNYKAKQIFENQANF